MRECVGHAADREQVDEAHVELVESRQGGDFHFGQQQFGVDHLGRGGHAFEEGFLTGPHDLAAHLDRSAQRRHICLLYTSRCV